MNINPCPVRVGQGLFGDLIELLIPRSPEYRKMRNFLWGGKKGNADLFLFEIEHNLNQYTLWWWMLTQVNREKKPPRSSLGCWPRGKKSGLVTWTQWESWGERVSEAALAADTYLPDRRCVLAVGPLEPGMVQVWWSFLGRHILGKWDFPALKNHCLEAHNSINAFFESEKLNT